MFGVSSLVVGLTVVGFGTSSPELAVSSVAAYKGAFELSLGNIVGSNIFNLLGILGMLAAIRPIKVHSQIVRLDLPVMLLVTVLLWLLLQYTTIPIYWGWILLALLALYTTILLIWVEKEKLETPPLFDMKAFFLALVCVGAGLFMLIYGSESLIQGAVGLGTKIGVSQRVIGLTIVAIGTSIPEIATCLVSLYRRQVDLAVGNIIGSNIYNILAILAVSLLSSKSGVDVSEDSRSYDLLFLVIISLLTYLLLKKGHHMSRKAGLFFISLYFLYLAFILI